MSNPGAIMLITETAMAHGVHDDITEDKRLVLCQVEGVGLTEYYQAYNTGLRPEIKFRMTLAEDYHGESRLEYLGKSYDIIRTKLTEEGGLEIVAQREDIHEPDSE